MANATDLVKKGTVRRSDEWINRPSPAASADTYYWPGAMVGLTTAGYITKFDDAASMLFFGVVRDKEGRTKIPNGATAGEYDIPAQQPQRFELAIASVAITDIGKKVYASDDQTGVLTNGGTYGNFVGHVVDVVSSGIALVEPCYDGIAAHARYGVSRTMAATGAQTITKFDLNKTIFVPNTATLTLTLPAVADTQAGDRLKFVKSHASDTNAITLDGNASETIDGATTLATLDAPFDCVEMVSTGSAWIVLNRDIA